MSCHFTKSAFYVGHCAWKGAAGTWTTHVVTDSQLLAGPTCCCPAEVCVLVFPAACRAAPGLCPWAVLPPSSGIWGTAKTSWSLQELGEGLVGGWSSGLGLQWPFQVCRCSSLHTGQCCPCQITHAEMLLRSFSSFLLAPGVLVLKCWSRCRF